MQSLLRLARDRFLAPARFGDAAVDPMPDGNLSMTRPRRMAMN